MFDIRPGDRVSVVVPSYNHEDYIEACLQSIFEQTYENVELIIVDDQSKDGTVERSADWLSQSGIRSRFSRVRLLRNEHNMGAHSTINRGILEAEGTLVAVLNSDDLFQPTRMSAMIDAMGAAGSGFGFSKVLPIDVLGVSIPTENLPPTVRHVFDVADQAATNFPAVSFGFLCLNIAISTGNFVFHRELHREIGLFRSFKYVHDWDFALRAILVTEPVYVPDALYSYRLHDTNSFLSLADVAEVEGLAVSQHFFDLARLRKVKNPLAPLEENWPGVCGLYTPYFGIQKPRA